MHISTSPSPEVENFQMKIYYLAGIEPEADMLPSEPARRSKECWWDKIEGRKNPEKATKNINSTQPGDAGRDKRIDRSYAGAARSTN